jgi:hypothetical protein
MTAREKSVVAAAEYVTDELKWMAYEAQVAKRPKRDKRDLSRASEQTKWVMEAVTEWYNFQQGGGASGMGLPTENVLYRAGLMIPRAPLRATTPELQDVPERVKAVNIAIGQLLDSRRRVLMAWERHYGRGIEYAAHKLKMSPNATERYLRQARQSIADIMRGMGWKVPQPEDRDRHL